MGFRDRLDCRLCPAAAERLTQHDLALADHVLLWIFALLDSQFGFALDLTIEYERVFGKDDIAQRMKDEAVLRLTKQSRYEMLSATAKSVVPRHVKQWIKKHIL